MFATQVTAVRYVCIKALLIFVQWSGMRHARAHLLVGGVIRPHPVPRLVYRWTSARFCSRCREASLYGHSLTIHRSFLTPEQVS